MATRLSTHAEIGFRYDFDLRTGKSETGLRACTYAVDVRSNPTNGTNIVWVETPEGGSNWRLIELQPVSEGTMVFFPLSQRMRASLTNM